MQSLHKLVLTNCITEQTQVCVSQNVASKLSIFTPNEHRVIPSLNLKLPPHPIQNAQMTRPYLISLIRGKTWKDYPPLVFGIRQCDNGMFADEIGKSRTQTVSLMWHMSDSPAQTTCITSQQRSYPNRPKNCRYPPQLQLSKSKIYQFDLGSTCA